MSTFSADQIVGKTLIANKTLIAYDLPTYKPGAKKIGEIKQGQPAGVVFSYVGGKPGEPLNWEFRGNAGKMYYLQHVQGNFNISSLRDQDALTTQEQIEKEEDQNKGFFEKLFESLTGGGGKIGKYILIGGGALIALNMILKNRKK